MEVLQQNKLMIKNTILITGASSGIGASTAIKLSRNYRIIACGRNKDRLRDVISQCEGEDNLIWDYDLSDTEGIEKNLSKFINDNNLVIKGLIHSAGIIKYLPVKSFKTSDFELLYKINVISAAMLVKTLSSKKHNSSALNNIVFVSSNISNFGAKAHALYSASKAALDGLMRSLAIELAPKIRVNSVLPGAIKTAMTTDVFNNPILVDKMISQYPLGLGNTDDIASTIKFLLSDDSRWITGQQIIVDGGRTINLSI